MIVPIADNFLRIFAENLFFLCSCCKFYRYELYSVFRYDEFKLATHDKQTLPAVSATTLEDLTKQE